MQKYFIKLLVVLVCFTFCVLVISSNSLAKQGKEDAVVQAKNIGIMIAQGKSGNEIEDAWKNYLKNYSKSMLTDAALQQILEEAMLEADKELQQNIDKSKVSDSLKNNIKDELNQERELHVKSYEETVSRSMSGSGSRSSKGFQGDRGVAGGRGLGSTLGQLNQYVGAVNSVLNTLATDPNLANTGIQNTLQEHQNTLQLISAAANVLYQIASPSQGQQSPVGYPSQQDQAGYPDQQGQAGYPNQQDQMGYPDQQGQAGYPAQQGQTGYPAQQGQAGYPSQQDQMGYPVQQGQAGYPAQQGQAGYPSQQGQTGYPAQQGQTGYPAQQGQAGYPAQQGQAGYPSQQGLMGQWQQSGYSSSLLGCWQCQTMSGPASFIFKSESLMIYNGELANYTLVPGAFRVFEGGITVDYHYELRQNNLLVTLPDGSYIQCMRMICR